MSKRQIPISVVATVADIIGEHLYSHTKIDNLFLAAGAPGDPPPVGCVEKCKQWLQRCNDDSSIDAFDVLGKILEEFMERDIPAEWTNWHQRRDKVVDSLAKRGLSYHEGGRIFGGGESGRRPARKTSQKWQICSQTSHHFQNLTFPTAGSPRYQRVRMGRECVASKVPTRSWTMIM